MWKNIARVKHGSAAVRYYRLRRRGGLLRNLNRVPDLRVISGAKSRAATGQLAAFAFNLRLSSFERCNLDRCAAGVLTIGDDVAILNGLTFGGVPVSTWETRQRRHAEDDALASLIIASKHNC